MSEARAMNIQTVALALLVPSPTEAQAQRRKHFDKDSLKQLGENIKSHGLVNPILARPIGGKFEIIAGERRFQAAKLAGLESIDVSVRDISDEKVLELQLIENLQREGLHELHEAEGYEALKKLGHGAVQIAEKVGKSPEYVYGRMKLLALCKDARTAFYDNKLSASTALLIARIPNEKLQKQALKEITEGRYGHGAMSYRDAAEHVQQTYMLRLDQAPFDVADAKLVPSAGSCAGCPKNTAQQRELFGDVKPGTAGVCTDTACFKAKTVAHADQVVAKGEAEGKKVLTGAAAKRVFQYNSEDPAYNSGYVKPGDKNYKDPKSRTFRQLAGKDAETVSVIHPVTSKVVELLPATAVAAGMKKQGIKLATQAPARSPKKSAADKKAAEKEKTDLALRLEVAKQLHEKAAKPFHRDELDLIAEIIFDNNFNDALDEVFGDDAVTNTKKMTEPQLIKYVRMHLLADAIGDTYTKPDLLFASAKRAGVNVDKVRKDLVTEAAKPAVKPAAKKK